MDIKAFSPTKTSSILPSAARAMKSESRIDLLSINVDAVHVQLQRQNKRSKASASKLPTETVGDESRCSFNPHHLFADSNSTKTMNLTEPAINDTHEHLSTQTACNSNDKAVTMLCKTSYHKDECSVIFHEQGMRDTEIRESRRIDAIGSIKFSVEGDSKRPFIGANTPFERFTREINEILNKIAPQNFEKLMNTLYGIKMVESCMLKKFISLIFEKAIGEQGFAYLYAKICSSLEARKPFWDFLDIVHNRYSNQYFWTKDLRFDESEIMGPFKCFDACCEESIGTDKKIDGNDVESLDLKIDQVVFVNNVIIQVMIYSCNLRM